MDYGEELRSCFNQENLAVKSLGRCVLVRNYSTRGRGKTVKVALFFDFESFPHSAPPGFHIASMSDHCELHICKDGTSKDLKPPQNSKVDQFDLVANWYYLSRPYTSDYSSQATDEWSNLPVESKTMEIYCRHVENILRLFFHAIQTT